MENMDYLIKKAGTLVEALPYIQKLYKKTVVVKYGGNAMQSDELKHSVMEDITLLKFVGANPIVVHGGGPDISAALKTYNIESNFINGLRVTDADTVQVAQQVLVGKTNKEIVSLIAAVGGKAVGLSGIDGHLLECEKLYTDVNGEKTDIGYVGNVLSVNEKLIKLVSEDEYIPVIAPIGVDKGGQSYNINADLVASAVAVATKAEKLIYLTDVEGVLDQNGKVIYEISEKEVYDKIDDGSISGGMIPKVMSCTGAIDKGVSRVHIIDGRIPHCILLEIFTNAGIGTMITP
ncbi:MAG: acetylglutamate kinase [Clostridia bacterium]|nr:acetylglutamate kinase [Clostridia bacterium]